MESGKENGGGASRNRSQRQSQSQSSSSTKSCKGISMYNSLLESKGRCPRCFGISRTLPSGSQYIGLQREIPASKEGRPLVAFYHGCLGYSCYPYGKAPPTDKESPKVPACSGFEFLAEWRAPAAGTDTSAHVHNKEDGHGSRKSQTLKPRHSTGDSFFTRFKRNSGLVASGVARNMQRVGNYVKQNIYDILDRSPK